MVGQYTQTSFFNTTRLCGAELTTAKEAAKSCQDMVLWIFKNKLPDGEGSAAMVMAMMSKYYPKNKYPDGSIRRSMTVLKNEGVLIKLKNRIKGKYGAREHVYKLIQ